MVSRIIQIIVLIALIAGMAALIIAMPIYS